MGMPKTRGCPYHCDIGMKRSRKRQTDCNLQQALHIYYDTRRWNVIKDSKSQSSLVDKKVFKMCRGGSKGRVQGVHTLPEMTCGFLIQLVFCKKKTVVYWCWSRARDECTPSYKKSWIRPWCGYFSACIIFRTSFCWREVHISKISTYIPKILNIHDLRSLNTSWWEQ